MLFITILNGRGGEARTPNTRFWRPVLYQLNYAPIGMNKLAEWTGLEPATPCVTGRYSNQLNYHSVKLKLVVPYSHMGKPHTTIGITAFHF